MKVVSLFRLFCPVIVALPIQAGATACIVTPTADASGAAARLGGKALQPNTHTVVNDCATLKLDAGTAMAQYIDSAGQVGVALVKAGAALSVPKLNGNAQPVNTVGRALLSILTDAPERAVAGKKFFDKPAQVGAPFGDVYIPPEGLSVRFSNLEGEARVQVFEGPRMLIETLAAQGLTLDRAKLRPGATYNIRIATARGKLPDGAFEIVAADVQSQLDESIARIERDERLAPDMRAVGKALLLEQEGLSFNREVVLRGIKK